ncbi:T9SS type B sorting domain-containing protein [Chitinophaga rhizophila]|uniref:Gliding motility-associated C-terminal domain-containing protein n=1 Tax=Chitinophaga rhizophila TaxID=2866212 RepID=A0ABS7GLH6_9BACT|nr:gliding motility-associated C-terminal domain-containing protein [Chitinophaga rhizophila]MBW8687343.1 gliding motility-associated C-terminal domain-containing protein [Chitinophaga rhizophila]
MNKPECSRLYKVATKHVCALLLCFCLSLSGLYRVSAQDIELKNPSLETKVLSSMLPDGWKRFEQSPDVQPGACGITQSPYAGNTYIGMMASPDWSERIVQELVTPLQANKTYTVSFKLAYPPEYFSSSVCSGSFAIYGANELTEKGEILWKSPAIMHQDWKPYTAVFSTTKAYKYFITGPYMDTICHNAYRAVLLDDFSPYMREVPQIIVQARNSCKGEQTGSATVRVKAGQPPYRYRWEPGNFSDSIVKNLEKGTYKVTVTGANGAAATTFVAIGENELTADVTSSAPICHGDTNGIIKLNISGGVSPYAFSIDGGVSYQDEPLFEHLKAGNYDIEVKDGFNCILNVNNFTITEPEPMEITAANASAVSCSSVKNGSVELLVTGGVSPYIYEISGQSRGYDNVVSGLDAGDYIYRVYDQHNCYVEGETVINKEWRDCAVFMPNAFSPNGDGMNDIFRAKVHDAVTEFRMAVYGRWGQLIFESRNPNVGWDGTERGSGLPAGSYLWVVTYTDSKLQEIQQKGTLVLVR